MGFIPEKLYYLKKCYLIEHKVFGLKESGFNLVPPSSLLGFSVSNQVLTLPKGVIFT